VIHVHDEGSNEPAREHRLTIVIPALDEAEAIGGTIRRCLDAREHVRAEGGVADVELIVVSDGSTDATAAIARGFAGVTVLEFERNRGYGAAIKAGFAAGSGDLVGFLDADGTCDPLFFAELCRAVADQGADVALGSRMSGNSRMPWIRTVGNRAYAVLLSLLSNQQVSDTASGMRVIRRACLRDLGPLPDGLHYTPAMSARAVLKGLKVTEIPMSYSERIGRSKLRVSRDGWRFLQAILDGVLLFRPERVFVVLALLALAAAALLSLGPVEFYVRNARVEEWMVYRFVVAFLLGSAGVFASSVAALVSQLSELALERRERTFWMSLLIRSFRGVRVTVLVVLLVAGSVALVWPGLVEYASTRHVTLHWSRVMVAAFGLLVAFQALLTGVLLRITTLWLEFAMGGERRRGP
jgi:glycosyltransferase involved in cell wall biosynthesis